jgi:hypothetical protein
MIRVRVSSGLVLVWTFIELALPRPWMIYDEYHNSSVDNVKGKQWVQFKKNNGPTPGIEAQIDRLELEAAGSARALR